MVIESNFTFATGKVPDWIPVAPLGSWVHPRTGAFEIAAADAKQICDNSHRAGIDIVVDYEHQTLTGAKAPAAGWLRELQLRDTGVWGRVEWTKEAAQDILAGRYRYYSPVIHFNAGHTSTGAAIGTCLHSVGLTNTPLLTGSVADLAAAKSDGGKLVALAGPQPPAQAPAQPQPSPTLNAPQSPIPLTAIESEVCRQIQLDPAKLVAAKQAEAKAQQLAAALTDGKRDVGLLLRVAHEKMLAARS